MTLPAHQLKKLIRMSTSEMQISREKKEHPMKEPTAEALAVTFR